MRSAERRINSHDEAVVGPTEGRKEARVSKESPLRDNGIAQAPGSATNTILLPGEAPSAGRLKVARKRSRSVDTNREPKRSEGTEGIGLVATQPEGRSAQPNDSTLGGLECGISFVEPT
jgi:hypothetical protein